MTYQPDSILLNNYADVLVNFGLNGGQGIKKGEIVFLQIPESARPLLKPIYRAVLAAKAHPILQYLPDEMEKDFFELASDEQLHFFPAAYLKAKVKTADHFLTIIAETDKHELEGIDPQKIMDRSLSFKPYRDWRTKKESANNLTWTLGLYPTQAMANEAKISLDECWQQVIRACYLDVSAPVSKWKTIQSRIHQLRNGLNQLPIISLNIKSTNTDLTIGIDKNRNWLGCDGRNIPSFEIFISPDWRQTEGYISFDLPLYRYGNEVRDIYLEFHHGRVTRSKASKGEPVLQKMIAAKNADKVGEFSLTDIRYSRISRFMAETLYDENFGGKYGNSHIALGMAYQDSFPGKISQVTKKQWQNMGYNDSVVHTDLITTTDRQVTATLIDGTKKVIYRQGKFTI